MTTESETFYMSKKQPVKINFSNIFPWICLCITFLAAVLFQIKYGKSFINSDLSAEMLLAKELNDSHSLLFAKNWFYSTELRVLYQHIPLRLGLLLFPDNWYFARVLGQAIMLALHAASFIYLMSATGHKKAGIYGAAALMCPFGFWYLFHGIFGGQYLTHMILISVSIGLILKITNESSKSKLIIKFILLFILALLQGLGGVRMLMNLYVPLLLAVIIMYLLRVNQAPFEGKFYHDNHFKIIITTAFSTIICTIGFLINSNVLSKIYVFASHNDKTWKPFSLHNFVDTLANFLSLWGYPYNKTAQEISTTGWTDINLLSLQGILSAACIILIGTLIFAIIRLFKLWNKLNFFEQLVFGFFLACLLVDSIVYSLLESDVNASYWLPIVPLVFAVVIIWIKNEAFRLSTLYQRGITIILFVSIICVSISSTMQYVKHPPRTPVGLQDVADWLVDNGYERGCTTFWYADALTELTNGQVETWTICDIAILYPYEWLQKRDHINPPESPFFILLPEFSYEVNNGYFPYYIFDDTVVYNKNGYTVLSYTDVDFSSIMKE